MTGKSGLAVFLITNIILTSGLALAQEASPAPAPTPAAALQSPGPKSSDTAPDTAKGEASPATPDPAATDPDAALHHTATLGGLNKITAKVSHIILEQDVPTRFGSLEITLRTCKASPPEDAPEVVAFLEISDVGDDSNSHPPKPLFKGWMFASSPSLSALDHPIYDVWVISCKTSPAELPSPNK